MKRTYIVWIVASVFALTVFLLTQLTSIKLQPIPQHPTIHPSPVPPNCIINTTLFLPSIHNLLFRTTPTITHTSTLQLSTPLLFTSNRANYHPFVSIYPHTKTKITTHTNNNSINKYPSPSVSIHQTLSSLHHTPLPPPSHKPLAIVKQHKHHQPRLPSIQPSTGRFLSLSLTTNTSPHPPFHLQHKLAAAAPSRDIHRSTGSRRRTPYFIVKIKTPPMKPLIYSCTLHHRQSRIRCATLC